MITLTDDFYLVIFSKWDVEMLSHWVAYNINQILLYQVVFTIICNADETFIYYITNLNNFFRVCNSGPH